MVDHLAWAQGYRDRAAKCQLSAKNTSSVEFGECYRLLEQYYLMLANLEEDFRRRQVAVLMPPVSPQEVDKKLALAKQAGKPAVSPKQPNGSTSLKEDEVRPEDQSAALSVSARMLAVRQLQASTPSGKPLPMPVPPSAA